MTVTVSAGGPNGLPTTKTSREIAMDFVNKVPQKFEGQGVMAIPGLPCPNLLPGDADRDVKADYEEALATSNNLAMIYCRKFATVQRFAQALESELERLRKQQQ